MNQTHQTPPPSDIPEGTYKNPFIAYYRLSQPKFDKNGEIVHDRLGLESQRAIALDFLKANDGTLLQEFTEIKSGNARNRHKRTEIHKAIALAKSIKATLIFAYVDRFARDVEFINWLINSGVKFVCCDSPYANDLTINMIGSFAQEYSRSVSVKTKAALDRLKKKGVKLGSHTHKVPGGKFTEDARKNSIKTRRERAIKNENNVKGANRAFMLWVAGHNYTDIYYIMKQEGYKTATDKPVYKTCIGNWLKPMIRDHVRNQALKEIRAKKETQSTE